VILSLTGFAREKKAREGKGEGERRSKEGGMFEEVAFEGIIFPGGGRRKEGHTSTT
jgi:hypothetical protein